jgi:hypothetical protein
VAPLAAADNPLPDGADPARAAEGSATANAIAATLAITMARPIDENPAFRANIPNILHSGLARQAACSQPLKPC